MIRINLLPHREEKRKLKKQQFGALLLLGVVAGGLVVMLVGGWFAGQLAFQESRNDYIREENKRLAVQIKEVKDLRQEIDALKARQKAVEDLQADRNMPVYLLDQLAEHIPEGVYLSAISQSGQRISLDGYAQSNERVSELLRHLGGRSPWFTRPELIEIRSSGRTFVFKMRVNIRRPSEIESSAAKDGSASAGSSVQRS